MSQLTIGGTVLLYEVRRSERAKRLRIVVTPKRIEVIVPAGIADTAIERFVQVKRRWIFDQAETLRERALEVVPARFVSGAKVLYRGRFLKLRVEGADVLTSELRYATAFHVRVPKALPPEHREKEAERLVTSWLHSRTREDAHTFASRHAKALGAAPTAIRVHRLKTVWGSCGPGGVLHLDGRLGAAPRPVFEYVVVHELCHLKERNHGPAFWRLVASLLPGYEARKEWLERFGVGLG